MKVRFFLKNYLYVYDICRVWCNFYIYIVNRVNKDFWIVLFDNLVLKNCLKNWFIFVLWICFKLKWRVWYGSVLLIRLCDCYDF